MNLSIINGRLVLPGQDEPVVGTLRCEGDRITGAGGIESQDSDTIVDAKGQLVAPGLVDLGVFAIDKPAFHFGGITRAAIMPDQSPALDHPARIQFAALSGKPDFWVHPICAATRALNGTDLAELALMKEAGAKAIGTGRNWIADSGVMHRLLQYGAALDMPVLVHSEDAGMAAHAVATSGEMATRLGLSHAPLQAESLAILRDLELARMTGARIHFRQVTTAAGLDLIRRAKQDGLAITCGITPAHLFLSDTALADFRTFARLSPPLRSEADREACIAAVSDGTIDVIASSHDPRGPEDKRLPFADAAPGMAGAETLLAMSLNLVKQGMISMGRLFDFVARNPARILGVEAGSLETGYEADIALIKPDLSWRVDSAKMAATAGNTPFDKLPVEGRVTALFKGGKPVEL